VALESLIAAFKALCAALPDRRKGENTVYEMGDIGMAAFAVFFMQSPSFLAQQTALERGRGGSNGQTQFAMRKIPTDNHIRSMLDPVPPETLLPMFGKTLAALEESGGLAAFQRLGGHVLIALDGTEYFCSQKLSCPNCSERKRANGKMEHFRRTQWCRPRWWCRDMSARCRWSPSLSHRRTARKNRIARRAQRFAGWLAVHGPKYARLKPIYLGDDLSSRQATCAAVR
jgi:hypothetical protein